MTAPDSPAEPPASPRRRRRLWPLLLLAPPAALAGASWWITAPLDDRTSPDLGGPSAPSAPSAPGRPPAAAIPPAPDWPEGRLEGEPAKAFLLASLERTAARLDAIGAYTATFRKRERVAGKLGPVQTMAMKVRHRPFAIYLKFLAPRAGKEVVYAEGHRDNKMVAHNGDWTRRLVPRIEVAPDSALAMTDNRHPITEAGLAHLAGKLVAFRKLDLGDDHAVTILDRAVGPDGRPRLRSVHTHTVPDDRRPFARVEVLYDPETRFPVEIRSYDWPAPGQAVDAEPAEHYIYDDLKLDAPLTDADFDPANPDYAFHRY